MTTQERSEAILKKILEMANNGNKVAFEEDWGGNSLTISSNTAHTHVGDQDGSWESLVEGLYRSLIEGGGLSWHDPAAEK